MTTGLEKILGEIQAEAAGEADSLRSKAREEAKELLSRTEKECEERRAEGKGQAEELEKTAVRRARSSADLKKRQLILRAKQELIAELIDSAYRELLQAGEAEYFGFLEKMLASFVLPKEGEICFSERDLGRMPESFRESIARIAGEKGGSLSLLKEPGRIDGGFILIYGGVEENCSLKALFGAKKDALSDLVHGLIFS